MLVSHSSFLEPTEAAQMTLKNYHLSLQSSEHEASSRFSGVTHKMTMYTFALLSEAISGSKRDENRKWRRLHNEELHSLYRLPNIVRVIKSKTEMDR